MLAALACSAAALSESAANKLKADIQAAIDSIANVSGYAFSVGYHDATASFGVGAGSRSPNGLKPFVPGTVGPTDSFLLGSGTKPFTAAAVMRLVDRGKVSLDDLASDHIDAVMQRLNGTSMVGLFGDDAKSVTVGQLLSMQSGIGDYDVKSFDDPLLAQGNSVHSVFEPLYAVGAFSSPNGCDPNHGQYCTFVCNPGKCTEYSSTNYILLGLLLLAHAPAGQQTVQTFDQLAALGLSPQDYPNTATPTQGALHKVGLTVGGDSQYFGSPTELYTQDASILGWTCGNVAASAHDTARFYYELLGRRSIVSQHSLKTMATTSTISRGWESGEIDYGYGLMIQNVSPKNARSKADPAAAGSYLGHAGDTYAFMSDNGFFPALNASISVISNEDFDPRFPTYVVTCKVVELVYAALGSPVDLKCLSATPLTYFCHKSIFGSQCVPSSHGGVDKATCDATCSKADAVEEATPLPSPALVWRKHAPLAMAE